MDFYNDHGYTVVRSALPAESLERVRSEVVAWQRDNPAPDKKNLRYRFKNNQRTQALELDTIDPVLDVFPSVQALVNSDALQSSLAQIYGEPACLFKDKLILKNAGVTGYPLHQDYIAWPNFPRSFTTVTIPLDPATKENGCIEVFPGVHKSGYLSKADGDFHDLPETRMGKISPVALELAVGDFAIFGCYVPHRSSENRTSAPRRSLYLSFNKQSELGDYRDRHYDDYRAWLLKRYQEFGATDFFFK